MTLAVERHEGATLWLVEYDERMGSTRLAQFINPEAVKAWKAAHNAALLAAREVGRSGL